MARIKELHGAAFQKSQFSAIAAFWIHQNPRMTSGKLKKKLIDKFGRDASFSEPHLQSWMNNYFPEIIKAAFAEEKGRDGGARTVASLSESKLFGTISDPLDYHQQMIMLLESRLKEAESEYQRDYEGATADSTPPEERLFLSRICMKLRDQIVKYSKEIREYKEYIDEWQRVHDVGERLGDLMYRMIELSLDTMLPEVPGDRRVDVKEEFAGGYKKIAREFKIPLEKVYGG